MLIPFLLSVTLGRAAIAQSPEDMVTLEVLPGWRTEQGTQMAGLRLTLAPGWKTYWRAPGDAGIPPAFNWRGSQNIDAAEFHWPVPEVFQLNGMQSIGYTGQVVIPIELTPTVVGQPARIAGEIEIGVCEEICVPVHLSFDAPLTDTTHRDLAIATALVDRPLTATEADVGRVLCATAPSDNGLSVTAQVQIPVTGAPEVVVIEAGDPRVWVSEAETSRDGDWLTARVQMIPVSGGAFSLDRSAVRITVLGSDKAVDIRGCTAG